MIIVAVLSITLVLLSTVGWPLALLTSLSVKVVVDDALGAPAFGVRIGVNTRASSSAVIAVAVPDRV